MVRKKLKANPDAYCQHLIALLLENQNNEFVQDFLSGIMGKHRVPIEIILKNTGLSILQLADYLLQSGIGVQKIQHDCSDMDPYKPALVAALHEGRYQRSLKRESLRRNFWGTIVPIMPPRNEAKRPYVFSMAFRNEVAHSNQKGDENVRYY